ncbi:unnamed protein product [Pneumocystis jirovecii]|uniref:DNA replication ATP-dependent helicase/nuclease n=1 Tax=Pneumocystis jirovecii TaxID=42068 RepID=L0PEA0_PNEJI|nr:unnamed protein product [Pneumocystis jirovecii]
MEINASDTSDNPDNPSNTDNERVMWKMSPIKESPCSARPSDSLFALFMQQNSSEDKLDKGLDPTVELWSRCKTAYNTENIKYCGPATPVQRRVSVQRRRAHTAQRKHNIREMYRENKDFSTQSSVTRLVDALRMLLPDPLSVENGVHAQESRVYTQDLQLKETENNTEGECMENHKKIAVEWLSDDLLDDIEDLEALSELSDEQIDQDAANISINKENAVSKDSEKHSVSREDFQRNFQDDKLNSVVKESYNSFFGKNLTNNDGSRKKDEYLEKDSISNTIAETTHTYDDLCPTKKMVFSPENNTFKSSTVTEKIPLEAKKIHKNVIELPENKSFHENDNIYTSFSDDMLDASFADDVLDEEIEAVLSVLDTCQEPCLDPAQVLANTGKDSFLTDDLVFDKNKKDFIKPFNPCKNEVNDLFVSYRVCDVKEQWIDSHEYKGFQKVIFLEQDNRIIQLRQDWFFTPVEIGDDLYLHGQYDENGICIVDNSHYLVILNPDYLISCTSIANSYSCIRKTIIQEKVKIIGDISKSQVYGKILHCLFQLCLQNSNFSLSFLKEKTQHLILSNLESLDEIGENIESAMEYICQRFSNLQEWASRYFLNMPGENSRVTTHQLKQCSSSFISISKLLKIEEHIWSPKYGLKGSIDATVQIALKSGPDLQYLIAPFELKTGNNTKSMEHRAQTILYTLLLSQHYDINVNFGILFYLEKGETIQVFAVHNEIRGLIITRNNIAKYLKNYQNLPCMLKNTFTCKRCPVREPCFANESGTGDTSGLGNYFDEKTNDITPEYRSFFQHWSSMLSKEENETFRFRKELWSITSKKREEYGRCLSNLKIKKCHFISNKQEMLENINCYTYTLEKHCISSNDNSFLDSEISYGDYIIVSDESGHFALANGSVIEIELASITISVNKQLHKNDESVLYRIDKDELKNGISLARDNLTKLLYLKHEERRRELIINLSSPKFNLNFTDFLNIPSYEELNDSQKAAIFKVMTALDYALILGMPGTGKSTTIACLIQILIANNKTVLLTSYTHSAIDNILLKLDVKKENVLRLGSIEKIHPNVKEKVITQEYIVDNSESFQLKYIKPSIVATTCLGITHSIFSKRTFDYCIIDEASQIVLPICIGPLRFTEKFVLVGDHYQLPPLMRSIDTADQDMKTSLFKHLSDANPIAIVNLEYQYRMNKDIMLLSNTLIYNGKLKCGDEKTACKFLEYGDFYILDKLHSKKNCEYICNINECWIKKILEPGLSVIFANTDYVPAPESRKGDRIQNDIEVELLKQIVICLLSQGVSESRIAVLSVYRSQIKLIQIDTVDSFQGRDKDCIIISFVRSNSKNKIEGLLRDWRRLNVAFTRAKSKLIFFGSKSTLKLIGIFGLFFNLLADKQWIYDLPENAHLLHNLDSLVIPKQTNIQESHEKQTYLKRKCPILKTIAHAL